MNSLAPSSAMLEASISALEVLRNFLQTEGASVVEVESRLIAVHPDWSLDQELSELFSSIIECESDDFDRFSQLNALINAKVGSLTFELYTRASPGPLIENATEDPRSLHMLPTLAAQSSDALDPALLAVPSASRKTPASSDQTTPASSPSKERLTLKQYVQRKKEKAASQIVSTAPMPSSPIIPAENSIDDTDVNLAFIGLFPIPGNAATLSSPPLTHSSGPSVVVAPIPGSRTRTSPSAEGTVEVHVDAIRSMDGRFGAILIDKDIVVTTPNVSVVHAPITPHCQTRMRRSFNFAKDDPLYWPQPFHLAVGHLAVVPCPSNDFDHPLRYAWYQLLDDDFVQIQREGVDGLVSLAVWVGTKLKALCSELLDSIRVLDDERWADLFLSRGRDQIRKYLEWLTIMGTRFRVSLVFSCLQRVFLETYARWQWLTKWYPRLCDVDSSYPVDDSIIGAFTGDLSMAADLYRIGCPLWLTYTTLHDTSPPHRLIYSGLPGCYTRYARISQFLQQYFSNPIIESFAGHDPDEHNARMMSNNVPSGSSSRVSHPSVSSTPPVAARYLKDLELVDLAQRDTITLPILPPPKKKKKNATSGDSINQIRRNRFLSIPSPLMPSRLVLWNEANNKLSDYHLRSGPLLLEQAYPPPDVFFTPSNDLKVSLLLVWLRLRPLFQWKLSLPTRLKGYKNTEWRALFEAVDGKKVESMKARAIMLRELEELCRQSSLVFQLDELPLPRWSGELIEVNSHGELDSRVVTEVLWELLEVNFRMELITLDRAVVPEPQGDSNDSVLLRDG
ncbi:hypothetical protein F5878DRAFT_702762 [Lentinula raphanica]|uniref:Uncharacterized protein n=1 Tax=Lentinula raphanica TaxID=153919 RepID=A0AA38U5H0_9AGAR|nr:hypothetical protein F5878DRAFT_702762 [Lentinula raphanica]